MTDLHLATHTFISTNANSISDDFEMLQKLGEGSFSIVIKARHKTSNKIYAVKVINKAKVRNLAQLDAEVETMKLTDHPHIARLYSVYSDIKSISLVLEYCEGWDMLDFLMSKQSLKESEACCIFVQILRAISHLHSQHICHRDLKLENFVFAIRDDIHSLKLIDFGLSKLTSRQGEIMRTRVGSPYYIAPEVLRGQYNLQCDMWSAGVLLYVLLSGFPPFNGQSESQIFNKIKKGIFSYGNAVWLPVSLMAKDLIDRLLLLNPDERLTVEQALQHPWILSGGSQVSLSLNLETLTQYKSTKELRKAVLFCIARQCSECDIEDLRQAFEALDKNGDGMLTYEEFRQGLSSLSSASLAELWASLDVNHSNTISYTEFLAATMDRSLYCRQEKLWEAFVAFDRDGSGKISARELRTVLGKEEAFAYEEDFWEQLIREADKNADGEIDFSEFIQLMDDRKTAQTNSRLHIAGLDLP